MKKIYFTYSDVDANLYKELRKHFSGFVSINALKIIDKDELFRINADAQQALKQVGDFDAAVPLISIDYLTNNECLSSVDTAVVANKIVIPVLLRPCLWQGIASLEKNKDNFLPVADGEQAVVQRIKDDGNNDGVLSGIALAVKAKVFAEDLDKFKVSDLDQPHRTFHYILAGLILAVGVLGYIIVYSKTGDWALACLSIAMSLVVALFSLKKVLFSRRTKNKK